MKKLKTNAAEAQNPLSFHKDGLPHLDDLSPREKFLLERLQKLQEQLSKEKDNHSTTQRQLREAEHRAHRLERDGLTGLFVKAAMDDAIASQQLRVDTGKSNGGVVLSIDMRFLKIINDTYGHDGGNAALSAFGKKLASIMRSSDIVARPGGDEFVVVMPDTSPQESLRARKELKKEMKAFKFDFDGQTLEVGVRMGFAKYNADIPIKEALTLADKREGAIREHMKKSEPPRYG